MSSGETSGNTAETPATRADAPAVPTPAAAAKIKGRFKRSLLKIALAIVALYAGVALYQTMLKPLPAGLSLRGEPWPAAGGDVEFLCDVTGMQDGRRVVSQELFDRALKLIGEAQDFVVADLFLYNSYLGRDRAVHRQLCREVTEALLEAKRTRPGIRMVVISDPVNQAYGGPVPEHLTRLREAGIPVVLTDLRKLRDSSPVYSSAWRLFAQWLGQSSGGRFAHPFDPSAPKVGVRSWLALLNFKANHRKLLVVDAPAAAGGRQLVSLVMSANPHDGSSAHGNVGLLARNGVWRDLLKAEQAILKFSGSPIDLASWLPDYAEQGAAAGAAAVAGGATVRVISEGQIRRSILEALAAAGSGDSVDLGMFYLSERRIVDALLKAARKGARVRLLLDPNRDAFGYEKDGIPNRPVAAELMEKGGGKIAIRWADTHGEQFHSKLLLIGTSTHTTVFAGSANFTRRNIGDYNLETDLMVSGDKDFPAIRAAGRYFERLWTNEGMGFTVPYEAFAEKSTIKHWKYRFKESTGLSTF